MQGRREKNGTGRKEMNTDDPGAFFTQSAKHPFGRLGGKERPHRRPQGKNVEMLTGWNRKCEIVVYLEEGRKILGSWLGANWSGKTVPGE